MAASPNRRRSPYGEMVFDEAFWDSFWVGAFQEQRVHVAKKVTRRLLGERAQYPVKKLQPRIIL